jgi:hypothetical protein
LQNNVNSIILNGGNAAKRHIMGAAVDLKQSYGSDTGTAQPERLSADIGYLRAMEPEVKEKNIAEILEKALQNNGESVIFKNKDALTVTKMPIQANPKRAAETLRQFEIEIKDSKTHEIGVVVRLDGELLYVVRGLSDRVAILPEWEKDNIVTHNHASGSYAPSVKDVNKFVAGDGIEIRTVGYDGIGSGLFSSLVKLRGNANLELGQKMSKRFGNAKEFHLEVIKLAVAEHGYANAGKYIMRIKDKIVSDWLSQNALRPDYMFAKGDLK